MAKMGRPTDNPKPYRINVRLDEKCLARITAYCEQEKINRVDAIRRGIMKLEGDIKTNK